MPSMDVTREVAGAGASQSLLVNQQYEYLPYDSFVELAVKWIGKSSANAPTGVVATIYSGSDLLVQEGELNDDSGSAVIEYPESFLYSDAAFQGERLSINVRTVGGTEAGNARVRAVVRITPSPQSV